MVERHVEGLDDFFIERVVSRLLEYEPEAAAVLLTGSYAKGTAAVGSDLDLTAITESVRVGYRMWFEERPGDPGLHISVDATTAEAWLQDAIGPARWSLGFPAIRFATYLQSDAATRIRLGDDPSLRHPPADPELEDFVELLLKAKRAGGAGDERGLRWFAQSAAALAPALLIPFNDERVVGDRREALDAALSTSVAPDCYVDDLAVCLGVAGSSTEEVWGAIGRLGRGLLGFLRERALGVDDQPEIARYLADGSLERQLALLD